MGKPEDPELAKGWLAHRAEQERRYRAEHPERHLEAHRRYRERHPDADRIYRETHEEEIREYGRRYFVDNKARALENQRRYRAANRDKVRAAKRKYRAEHPEKTAEESRRYYDPAKARRWRAKNPEKAADIIHRRRVRLIGGDARRVTPKDIASILRNYRNRCGYCGTPLSPVRREWHLDHAIPLKRGGRHAIGNLVPACKSCNHQKSTRLPIEWRRVLLRRSSAAA